MDRLIYGFKLQALESQKPMWRLGIFSLCIWTATAMWVQHGRAAEIGSRIENIQLPDVSGTVRSLEFDSGKVVVLVFWSFKCPVALAYDNRMDALQAKYGSRGVSVFGIDAATNETPAEIRANIDNLKITVPVLVDSEGNLAEKLGATYTPSVFILDGNSVLRYKGALDNNRRAGNRERAAYVEDALDAILAGRPVSVPEARPFGCSIKRGEVRE
jgi:peroxiredoxin